MNDLLERLRRRQPGVLPYGTDELLKAAANEIDRLRSENRYLWVALRDDSIRTALIGREERVDL